MSTDVDSGQPCSELSVALGEPIAGTAAFSTGYLMVEHPGPWPADPEEALAEPARGAIRDICSESGLRFGLIRRPESPDGHLSGGVSVLVCVPDDGGLLVSTVVADHDAVQGLDIPFMVEDLREGIIDEPWQQVADALLVCTHAKRDECCARIGRPLMKSLAAQAPGMVWQTSHLHGHRFSGTALHLPSMIVYGRLSGADADPLLRAVREHRPWSAKMRGRSSLPAALQVAEIETRSQANDPADDAVILLDDAARGTGEGVVASEWEVNGEVWTAVVRDAGPTSPPRRVSCAKPKLDQPIRYEVVGVSRPAGHDAAHWDREHAGQPDLFAPNPIIAAEVTGLSPGRALDLASGTGRHSLLLAQAGWDVTAVDFSSKAIETLRHHAHEARVNIHTEVADVNAWQVPDSRLYDLIVLSFVQLPDVFHKAARWLAPGGRVVLVGHAERNLRDGVGGPSDPRLLHDPIALAAKATGARLRVLRVGEVERNTPSGQQIDAVLVAENPVPSC